MKRFSTFALAASAALDGVSAMRNLYCGVTYTDTYNGSPIQYNFPGHAERTMAIRSCGLTDFDTKIMATNGADSWDNDDMGPACLSNGKASQITWVARTKETYTVTVDAGAAYTGPDGVEFQFEVLCAPTLNLSPYMHNVFTNVAPAVDTEFLSCLDGHWHINGSTTCVGCGYWYEGCPTDFVHCSGYRNGVATYGWSANQATSVLTAQQNLPTKRYPDTECPAVLECLVGEFECGNGNCVADPHATCNCVNDCGDSSDEDPVMCGYQELTCDGPRLGDTLMATSSHGYSFTIEEEEVGHPRTCTPVTNADTYIEIRDANWGFIGSNEDCGPVLCPGNPKASGLSKILKPGDYHVCVKPGATFDAAAADYGVELKCVPRLDDYWMNLFNGAGLDAALLECAAGVWVYDGQTTCVGCGYFKDPCDNGTGIYCTGATVFGTGADQVDAVVTAISSSGGKFPGTTCV